MLEGRAKGLEQEVAASAQTPAPGEPRQRAGALRLDPLDLASRFGLLGAWVIVIAVFSGLRPSLFFTTANFTTIFGSQAVLLILTIGLLLPLTAGEFDLSVAGVLGVCAMLVGYLNVQQGWSIGPAVLAAVGVALVVGLVNVFFILVVGVESIVVTLGTGTLLLGTSFAISQIAIGGVSQTLVDVARHELLGIQLVFYYGLALTAVAWFLFRFRPIGRYLYFVGVGRDVARLSGIRVDLVRAGALVSASLLAGVSGILLAGLLGSSDPNAGANYLLPAFAGAFLGATAITPGRFNPWGSFIAVYFLLTGISGLEVIGLSGWIEQVFYGGSLIVAVAISRLAGRKSAA